MATKGNAGASSGDANRPSSSVEELLLAALERGDNSLTTGRYLVSFKEGAAEQAVQSLSTQGLRVADARDFPGQAVQMETLGDAG